MSSDIPAALSERGEERALLTLLDALPSFQCAARRCRVRDVGEVVCSLPIRRAVLGDADDAASTSSVSSAREASPPGGGVLGFGSSAAESK